MKVAIFAELTQPQFEYLRSLAQDNQIQANFVVEQNDSTPTDTPQTPITGQMLDAVATLLGKSTIQVAGIASEYGVTTVEEALAHESVPSSVKELLEGYL